MRQTGTMTLEQPLQTLAQLGRCMQAALVTMAPTLLDLNLLLPGTWLQLGADLARRSADGLRVVADGNLLVTASELRNKGEVFCLVLDVARVLDIPEAPPFPLLDLVDRAYGLDPFPALWAVEGLGHDYADRFLDQGIEPRGILAVEATPGLPAKSLLMLHAGIGLGFAETLLAGARRDTPFDELRRQVAEIVRLCRANSRPGSLGAAVESLGLVTRSFHAPLVPGVDAALREVGPEFRGYFWHGVGRALYFLPINFFPCSAGQIFAMARHEAPDEEARMNAVAGAAWAFALVGQRDPRILAELVVRPFGEELEREGAFANGIASSTIMRHDTTPEAEFLASFFRYRPDPPDPALSRRWERLVRRPCEEALERIYPVLKRQDRLGDVFQYQDLRALAADLERKAA